MVDLIKKTTVRESTDKNVSSDFYEVLDERVQELIDRASERADGNGRKTVKGRDL